MGNSLKTFSSLDEEVNKKLPFSKKNFKGYFEPFSVNFKNEKYLILPLIDNGQIWKRIIKESLRRRNKMLRLSNKEEYVIEGFNYVAIRTYPSILKVKPKDIIPVKIFRLQDKNERIDVKIRRVMYYLKYWESKERKLRRRLESKVRLAFELFKEEKLGEVKLKELFNEFINYFSLYFDGLFPEEFLYEEIYRIIGNKEEAKRQFNSALYTTEKNVKEAEYHLNWLILLSRDKKPLERYLFNYIKNYGYTYLRRESSYNQVKSKLVEILNKSEEPSEQIMKKIIEYDKNLEIYRNIYYPNRNEVIFKNLPELKREYLKSLIDFIRTASEYNENRFRFRTRMFILIYEICKYYNISPYYDDYNTLIKLYDKNEQD